MDSEYIGERIIKMTQKGRATRRFMDVVREDMQLVVVTEDDVGDRERWRRMIHCVVCLNQTHLTATFPHNVCYVMQAASLKDDWISSLSLS